jgi:hypothetical protein
MKKILYSAISAMFLFLGSACEKDDYDFKATANITVINAAAGLEPIKVNPGAGSGFAYSKALNVNNYSSGVFGAFTGSNTITVVKSTDTTTKLFQRTVDLQAISTLYIAGTATAVDTIFRTETNFPYINSSAYNAENAMYIRFVNLSSNSGTVNVRISGGETNEVTALPYKGISAFKKYAALNDYQFEIMDATNTKVLTSFSVSAGGTRYKTASIIFRGLINPDSDEDPGPFPVGTFQVNYN